MAELLLDSLEIKGYRCFEHLTIEKLGRVNLIVGKNNVGKTALLEALWIYANSGYLGVIFNLLRKRNEFPNTNGQNSNSSEPHWEIRNIFYNRPSLEFHTESALFTVGQVLDISENEPKFVNKIVAIEGIPASSNSKDAIPSLEHKLNAVSKIQSFFIQSDGLEDKDLIEFWDRIEKFVLEDLVTNALHIITPKLVDIRFSGYPNGSYSRVPVVRLEGATVRVPLRSLGDGMTKLLGISSALVNCKDGMLLIDEIENGLHYSVLPDVWKLIFKTAKDLNVQVFATTHSKDCIEAFTQAAVEDEESEGMLIRLVRKNDEIKAFTFDEKELETITSDDIEVR